MLPYQLVHWPSPRRKQTGRFLLKAEPEYEDACRSLLLKQIEAIRPRAILLLGPEVAVVLTR